MSLFDSLGNGNQKQERPQQINAQQAMAQLRDNPSGVLGKIGLNVPAGMDNPQQIIQHLMQTGQVPQGRFAQAMQMMGQMANRQ